MNEIKNEDDQLIKIAEEKEKEKVNQNQLLEQLEKVEVIEENHLDKLIEKIPFNICHVKILLLMAIYCSGEGYVMIATSLIMPVIDKSWKLNDFQKGFIGGSIFLGFMVGALSVGFVSDRKGRKMAFTVGCIFSIIGSVLGVFSSNWIFLSITNSILGTGIGISIPSCMSLISEVTNQYARSMIMNWVWIFFPVGEIIACFVAKYYHVYDYTKDNWRKLLMFRIISFIFVIPFIHFVPESPKFFMSQSQHKKAFKVIKELLQENQDELTEDLKEKIIKQYTQFMDGKTGSNYSDLFNKNNLKLSLLLFVKWYIVSYVYYGLIYILPQILEKVQTVKTVKHTQITSQQYDEIIGDIIMSCLFEIPSDIANGFLPNISFLGRLGAINLGYGLSIIFSIMCYIFPNQMPFYASLLKATINTSFNILYIYTAEAYPTYMRATAIGVCNFFCRFGGFTCPFLNELLYRSNPLLPFIGFFLTSILGMFMTLALPFETFGRNSY